MNKEQSTSNKSTILITGASGNMGFAVTEHLINQGFQVLALDATAPRDAYVDHPAIFPTQLDLSDDNAVSEYIDGLETEVTAAILTVGGFAMGGFDETSAAQVRKMILLNFETAYNMVKALLPRFMKSGAGQFILIGARPALNASEGKSMIAYALSKGLVFQLSELINATCAGSAVHSTVLVPSTLDTAANRKSMPDANPADWVTAESIAEAIYFLLTDAGSQLRHSVLKMYHKA
jgi:NAD(P)-dependent dehydrogenase (short-subunit alcohol dehydrogenase family)